MKISITTTIKTVNIYDSDNFGFSENVTTIDAMNAEYAQWIEKGSIAIEDVDFTGCTVIASIVEVPE